MGALLALGVYDRIWEATPWLTEEQIDEILVFGPDPSLPTTTLWWLMVPAPHSNTPVALLLSLGMAAFALGAFLLLARLIGKALTPLAAAGSMTFTLYTLHLLFLGTGVYDLHPGFWFWMQVAAFGLIAVAWQRAVGQGPLEKLVAQARLIESREHILERTGGRYWFTGGVHWAAIITWAIGALTYLALAFWWSSPRRRGCPTRRWA